MVGINMRRVVQEEARRAGLTLDSQALQLLLELVIESSDQSALQHVLSAIDQGALASCNHLLHPNTLLVANITVHYQGSPCLQVVSKPSLFLVCVDACRSSVSCKEGSPSVQQFC